MTDEEILAAATVVSTLQKQWPTCARCHRLASGNDSAYLVCEGHGGARSGATSYFAPGVVVDLHARMWAMLTEDKP